MKKNVIVYGLIAGLIAAIWCVASIAYCYSTNNYNGNMLLGYASMLAAFSLIFVGVKNYRDKYNGGSISFGKAFLVGLYIALIASTIYVVAWLIDYYIFIPDFMDKFSAQLLRDAYKSGASKAEISKQIEQVNTMKTLYKNPVMVVLFTYLEILPVGLVVAIITALILKKKEDSTKSAIAN